MTQWCWRSVSWWGALLALGWPVALGCRVARADVLVPRSGPPLVGRLVERNERTVVFRERVELGKYVERRVPTPECLTVVVTIDDARLQTLNPERPEEYAALAEELALVPADLEARDLAIRLSLIAGRLGDEELRRQALLQLIHLARTPEEEIKFRKLAYLVEPSLDRTVLEAVRQVRPVAGAEDLAAALRVVQALRQSRTAVAQLELQKPQVQQALEPWARWCPLEQLQRFATTRQRSTEELLQLLKLEYAIRQSAAGWPDRFGDNSWGEQIENATVFQPTWDNVSEFRAEENRYMNGQWRTR